MLDKSSLLSTVLKSVLASVLISLGAFIYLTFPNILGACLFSIGLISVIVLRANLFTGKVGYVKDKKSFIDIIIILVVNLLIAFCLGLIIKQVYSITPTFDSRLLKDGWQIFFDSIICGILIYLAVELYKRTHNLFLIVLCVVCFITCGAEHSIADAFYLGLSDLSLKAFGYLGLIILGNAIGSLGINWLIYFGEKSYNKTKEK